MKKRVVLIIISLIVVFLVGLLFIMHKETNTIILKSDVLFAVFPADHIGSFGVWDYLEETKNWCIASKDWSVLLKLRKGIIR